MRSRLKSEVRAYAVCSVACLATLSLAVAAYRMSQDIAGATPAKAENALSTKYAPPRVNAPIATTSKADAVSTKRAAGSGQIDPIVISRAGPPVESKGSDTNVVVGISLPDEDEWASYQPWTPKRSGLYRTVCVRLCDGAYFPMTFATSREQFKADALRCETSCGSPSRLFVSRHPSEDAEDLVDVHGGAYADLPNAFKFRSAYDPACTCHAQPWDEAALARHRKLAAESVAHTAAVAVAPGRVAALEPSSVARLAAGALQSRAPGIDVGTPARPPAAVVKSNSVQTAPAKIKQVSVAAVSPVEDAGKTDDGKATKVAVPGVRPGSKTPATAKTEAVARKPTAVRAKPSIVGTRPESGRAVVAKADGAAGSQRSFRSNDYWRLSYWDSQN
jgi:hypothetical protein